jgi:hypothetical protein
MAVSWVEAPCSLAEVCCLHHQVALMMEVASTSETLVNFYQTTRRYNPENSHLRPRRRENLKSYLMIPISNSNLRVLVIPVHQMSSVCYVTKL